MFPRRRRQAGYLLPLALLVLISMGVMTTFMVRQINSSANIHLLDSFAVQASYAADSGTQVALHQLLAGQAERRDIDRSCLGLAVNHRFSSSALNQCLVTVSCRCVYENGTSCDPDAAGNYQSNPGTAHSVYELSSNASCGSGEYLARGQGNTLVHSSSAGFTLPGNLPSYRGHDRVISER